MIRLAALMLASVTLLPALPVGCPTAQPTTDQTDATARGLLTTTADAPAEAAAGETVTLRAAATPTDDNGLVYYAWLQTAGPGVRIDGADRAAASFVAPSLPVDRVLRFMVTTSSDAGDVGRAEVAVRITADPAYGRPALAVAGDDAIVRARQTVTLDGSASQGASLKYEWRQVSGPAAELADANGAQATFAAPAGLPDAVVTMTFELTVTDVAEAVSRDRVRVIVGPCVRVATSLGSFFVVLRPDLAPITVGNYLSYVDDEFYDGTLMHRVMPGFVVQGGGFLPGMTEKTAGDAITNESNNGLGNVRGSVAMARANDPDSARAQFYVNLANNGFLDYKTGQPGYAVFGQVVEGMDVVDRIAAVETTTQGEFENVPVEDVLISSIRRVE